MHRVQPKIFEISDAARAVRGVLQLLRGVSEDGSGPARLDVRVDERIALDAVVPFHSMVKLASVSSMWMGWGSPSRASGAASPSSLSSSQASPVSVENRIS